MIEPPIWRLPDKLFSRLEQCLGFELRQPHQRHIEVGIALAVYDRDVQLDASAKRRDLYAEIEHAAGVLARALKEASALDYCPFWLLYLGSDEALRSNITGGQVDASAHLNHLTDQIRFVKCGANALLKRGPRGRGAPKRSERELMCRFIAEAISDAGSWRSGAHDAKVVVRFARLLFPHIPKSVAHKSAAAFADDLCGAFNIPHLGRPEKFAPFA